MSETQCPECKAAIRLYPDRDNFFIPVDERLRCKEWRGERVFYCKAAINAANQALMNLKSGNSG